MKRHSACQVAREACILARSAQGLVRVPQLVLSGTVHSVCRAGKAIAPDLTGAEVFATQCWGTALGNPGEDLPCLADWQLCQLAADLTGLARELQAYPLPRQDLS